MKFATTRFVSTVIIALLGAAAQGAEPLSNLAIFKSGGLSQGLWRMEILNSSDPRMAQGAAAMGKMNICVDVAKEMAKNHEGGEQDCTPTVVSDSATAAEVAVACKDGSHSQLKIKREGDKNYLLDSVMTGKDGKARTFQARYSYQGACKGDSVIQMDKNSAACQKMGNVDMSKMAAMCANSPEQYRAQCEQQMKQVATMCQ